MKNDSARVNAASGNGDGGSAAEARVRAIAFHLPQFHPIPENDEWWGKGFTEWTNVVKTVPRLPGQYQPHLPADLGFYDLRLPEARAAQAALAAEYGVYGFCYFHYWFHGRRLLERPVNEILQSGEPDFPFCFCWANENWSRRWDASKHETLVEQRYSPQDDLEHIRALLPFLMDRRYVRVNGRPLIAVYRATQLPEPQRTAELWRREAERAGLPGLLLVRVESHDEGGDPGAVGFDVALQFEPRWSGLGKWQIFRRKWWHRQALRTGEVVYRDNVIYEYKDLVERALAAPLPSYPRIPCVCPSWDNSARRAKGAVIFLNSTPQLYERWLAEVANRQKARIPEGSNAKDSFESLIFINAWNEWAEANHLEPCQKWGRAYLEATRRALGVRASEAVEYAGR